MGKKLPIEKQVMVISALAEGNSIRSIERMTGVHRAEKHRGRPMLPAGKATQETIGVRVSPEEKSLLERTAAAAGTTLSAWSRSVLITTAQHGKK